MSESSVCERGIFRFEFDPDGNLSNNARNVEKLRALLLDRRLIDGELLGPGDAGDFDNGAWHVACHLVAAGGARRATDGRTLWLEMSHDHERDVYFPSITRQIDTDFCTVPLDSSEGRGLLTGSELLGFVEGNSTGRISARHVLDPPSLFNGWRRQDFDQPSGVFADGGKVWEHWCTLRDIRPSTRIGTSVLTSYISLVSALGDSFPAVVARGRHEYGHPRQLLAMVAAGVISQMAAFCDIVPMALPETASGEMALADPHLAVRTCESLDWSNPPRYYMFHRRLDQWTDTDTMRAEMEEFKGTA